jgi:hypothetical protein
MDYSVAQHEGSLGPSDTYFCPPAPKDIKPSWFGSRPTYAIEIGDDGRWRRGRKTAWRVAADGVTEIWCQRGMIYRGDKQSNYRRLWHDTFVYSGDTVMLVSQLEDFHPLGLVSVCEDNESSVFDYDLAVGR